MACSAEKNPFRVSCIEDLSFQFSNQCDWNELITSLARQKFRGAIIGPHGSGKTTLLLELAEQLRKIEKETYFIQLSDRKRSFSSEEWKRLKCNDVVLLDGAEQLSCLPWRNLLRAIPRSSGLVVTSHKPLNLPTVYRCESSFQLFRELACRLDRRLEDQAALLLEVYQRHSGNIRQAFFELYDCCDSYSGEIRP